MEEYATVTHFAVCSVERVARSPTRPVGAINSGVGAAKVSAIGTVRVVVFLKDALEPDPSPPGPADCLRLSFEVRRELVAAL